MHLPRGIRNNNPGNIEKNGQAWQGMTHVQGDPRFVQFETPFYGLRALMKTLLTYQRQHNLYSVSGIINRWAPPGENQTSDYVTAVARFLKADPHEHLDPLDVPRLTMFAQAIVLHENGSGPGEMHLWYSLHQYQASAQAALSHPDVPPVA